MHQDIEKLLNAAKEKGSITEKQREIILSKAEKLGEDISEVEFLLEDIPLKNGTNEKQHMKQCPNCGNMVAENVLKCPDCGYEFQNIDANKSIKQLFTLLSEVDAQYSTDGMMGSFVVDKSIRKKKTIIENFPIPNTKNNLIEFITALQPKALDTNDKLALSYYKKYEECINKAKTLYPNDDLFVTILSDYENVKAVAKKSMRSKKLFSFKYGCLFYIIFSIIVSIATTIWATWNNNKEKEESEKRDKEIIELVNSGRIEEAKSLAKTDESKKILYEYYMDHKDWYNAEKYINLKDYGGDYWNEKNCQAYFDFMKSVVVSMCSDGNKEEAIRFIKTKIIYYIDYNDENNNLYTRWNTGVVSTKLTAIVNNY